MRGASARPGAAGGPHSRPHGTAASTRAKFYTPDGQGGLSGASGAYGRDLRAGPEGGLTGAGANYGRVWRPDGRGGYDGVGDNYGKAWRRP